MRSVHFPALDAECTLSGDLTGKAVITKSVKLSVSRDDSMIWVEVHAKREQAGGAKAWELVLAEEIPEALYTESRLVEMVEGALR